MKTFENQGGKKTWRQTAIETIEPGLYWVRNTGRDRAPTEFVTVDRAGVVVWDDPSYNIGRPSNSLMGALEFYGPVSGRDELPPDHRVVSIPYVKG